MIGTVRPSAPTRAAPVRDEWAEFSPVAAPAAGQDEWAEFSPQAAPAAPAQAEPNSAVAIGSQFGAGANDFIATVAGAPVDAVTWGLNKLGAGIEAPIGGSDSIRRGMGLIGANPDDVVAPRTGTERIARMSGAGAAGALVPAAGALAVGGAATRAGGAILNALGAPTIGNLLLGATSGAAGAAAEEVVPEPYKPLAGLVGGVVGGVAPAAAVGAGRAGLNRLQEIVPLTQGQQRSAAGQMVARAADDPSAVLRATEDGTEILVPGAVPTLGQQTGDRGLLQLELGLRNTGRQAPKFAGQDAQRSAAVTGALDEVGGQGNVMAVPRAATAQFDEVQAQTAARVRQAEEEAERAIAAARARSEAEVARVQQEADARIAETRSASERAGQDVGGQDYRDEYGARIRTELRGRDQQARQEVGRLYDAIPDDAPIAGTRLQEAMEQLSSERTRFSAPLSGEEDAIMRRLIEPVEEGAENSGPRIVENMTLREARDLRQYIGDVVASSTGPTGQPTPTTRRLTILRNALDDMIDNPETGAGDAAEALRTASTAARQRFGTFGTGANADVLAGDGRGGFRLEDGRVGAKYFGPGPTAREEIRRLREAAGDTRAMDELADYAASQVRRSAGADGRFDPAATQRWVDSHAEALAEFPGLRERIVAAADAEGVARGAERAGTQAVRETERAGVASQADAVRQGAVTTREARTISDAEREGFQRSGLGRFLRVEDPSEVPTAIGRIMGRDDRVTALRALRAQVEGDPEAIEGVRRGMADFIRAMATSTKEAGVTGAMETRAAALQKFMRQNGPAMRVFLSAEDLRSMTAIGEELQRGARLESVRAVKGSQTAGNLAAAGDVSTEGGAMTIMARLGAVVAGGPAGYVSSVLLSMARRAGLDGAQDIATAAMMDPTLGRLLMLEASEANQKRAAAALERWARAGNGLVAASAATAAGAGDRRSRNVPQQQRN